MADKFFGTFLAGVDAKHTAMTIKLFHASEVRRIARLVGFTVPSTVLVFFFTFGAPVWSNDALESVAIRFNGFTLTYYHRPPYSHISENLLDTYDSFQKDATGNLVIAGLGMNRFSSIADSLYVGYVLKTNRGHPVTVYQQTPGHDRAQHGNCHGYVFLSGEYWILSSQVDKILDDNGWHAVSESDVEPGDVAVYRQANGRVCHSARVIGRDSSGHVLVNSKNGFSRLREGVRALEAMSS